MNEQTVLANGPTYQPKMKLMPFSGFEGEDFRNFKLTLENYFELSNIMDNKRKLVILKTQLYHAARTFVNKLMNGNSGLSYDEVMKKLMEQYITPELIQTYEYAFNNMTQGMDEHPRTFYTRLFEAAELAEIESDSMIQSRFRAGVHPIIRQHCVSLGCRDIDSWLKSAEGYWSAHHPQQVNMIGNPFHPQTIHHHADPSGINVFQPPTNPSLNSITTTASSNSLDMNDILKSL